MDQLDVRATALHIAQAVASKAEAFPDPERMIEHAKKLETFIWGGIKPEDRPAFTPFDSLAALDERVKEWAGGAGLADKILPLWERFMADAHQAVHS